MQKNEWINTLTFILPWKVQYFTIGDNFEDQTLNNSLFSDFYSILGPKSEVTKEDGHARLKVFHPIFVKMILYFIIATILWYPIFLINAVVDFFENGGVTLVNVNGRLEPFNAVGFTLAFLFFHFLLLVVWPARSYLASGEKNRKN